MWLFNVNVNCKIFRLLKANGMRVNPRLISATFCALQIKYKDTFMNLNLKNWYIAIGLQVVTISTVLAAESATEFDLQKIVCGSSHTCVISTAGTVKCWGENDYGALGLESTLNVGQLPGTMGANLPIVDLGKNVLVKDMCAGQGFSCALTTTGRVKCWGRNTFGALGQEVAKGSIGSSPNEMGDNLPWTNLGSDFVATNVQCGGYHACALNAKGQVKCWGSSTAGELGRIFEGRESIGNRSGDMGDKLPYLRLPQVKSLAVGGDHACAASSDSIYCWGLNNEGQAGLESEEPMILLPTGSQYPRKVKLEEDGVTTTIHSITSGYENVCAEYSVKTSAKRKIKCWGHNYFGDLGAGVAYLNIGRRKGTMGVNLPELQLDFTDFIQRETYSSFSCALKRNGAVQCWGANYNGQLGLGDTMPRGSKPEDLGKNLKHVDLGLPVLALSHGRHACAILINHEIKCWGSGGLGQLGYEDNLSRGASASDMGDNLPFVRYK